MPHKIAPSFPQYGGCQCGALRYQLSRPPLAIWACHCNQCRKQSGGAFGMSASVAVETLHFIAGAPAIWPRQTDAGHFTDCLFCARCGTRIAHRRREHGGRMALKPGTLDDTSWVVPERHVFTDTALDWVTPLIPIEPAP